MTTKIVTTLLLVPLNTLHELEIPHLHDHFARTYPLTVIVTVLFDLILRSGADRHYTSDELVQHVEEVIIKELELAGEPNPEFHYNPMSRIVETLYYLLYSSVWLPHLKNDPMRQMTAAISRVCYDRIEIQMMRVD